MNCPLLSGDRETTHPPSLLRTAFNAHCPASPCAECERGALEYTRTAFSHLFSSAATACHALCKCLVLATSTHASTPVSSSLPVHIGERGWQHCQWFPLKACLETHVDTNKLMDITELWQTLQDCLAHHATSRHRCRVFTSRLKIPGPNPLTA